MSRSNRISESITSLDHGADIKPAPTPSESLFQASGDKQAPREKPASRGGGAALLVHTQRELPGGEKQAEKRRLRYERRQRSSKVLIGWAREQAGLPANAPRAVKAGDEDWVRPPRVARCRWRLGHVTVNGVAGERAHYSNIERCGSVWACPVCSAVIRNRRSELIQGAARQWSAKGKQLAFLTLTLRHSKQEPLAHTLDVVLTGWKKLLQQKAWRRLKEEHGLYGFVRAIEVTVGQNGWHPHAHVLLFLDKPADEQSLSRLKIELYECWARIVTKLGGQLPSAEHGLDLRLVDGAEDLGAYLAKVQEHDAPRDEVRSTANEMTRADLKQGRDGNRMPFELLDGDSPSDKALWIEYYEATHGRRCITWSRQLLKWAKQNAVKADMTDEEILDEAVADPPLIRVNARRWDAIKNRPKLLTDALELVEADQVAESARLLGGQVLERPPD